MPAENSRILSPSPPRYTRSDRTTLASICRQLVSGYPGKVRSLYVLGSWVRGDRIRGSDIDFALVFKGRLTPAQRETARRGISAIRSRLATVIDVGIYDERDLSRGVLPYMKNNRLLFGSDSIRTAPLKSRSEMKLYFARQAVKFMRIVRGQGASLFYPLDYPRPRRKYFGYDHYGYRTVRGRYVRGLNSLVGLIASIAAFRLAVSSGFLSPDKGAGVRAYRRSFPNDPQGRIIERLYELGRKPGPLTKSDRARLASCCRLTLDLENDFLTFLIMDIRAWLPRRSADIDRRVATVLAPIQARAAPSRLKLRQLKKTFRPASQSRSA